MTSKTVYIIQETTPKPESRTSYVAAPPGKCRRSDGKLVKDGTCPKTSGAEMTQKRNEACEFRSHRAAARVRNVCGQYAEIKEATARSKA